MKGLRYDSCGDKVTLKAAFYRLEVDCRAAEASVLLSGTEIVSLDLRTAIPGLDDAGAELADGEPTRPVYDGLRETPEGAILTWRGKSTLWEKEYTLIATPLRLHYRVKIRGRGRVDSVNYFSGDLCAASHGSRYEFSRGFNPCTSWYNNEDYHFRASTANTRRSVLMVPPMFCYSFSTEQLSEQLAFGLVARRGEHNFHSLSYVSYSDRWNTTFWLSTDQRGHTRVDGEWIAPEMILYGAADEFDAAKKYCDYYFSSGIARDKALSVPPRFWQGPMVCGWIEQIMQSYRTEGSANALSRQEIYDGMLEKLKAYDLHPTVLFIDDKWQEQYGTDRADKTKWPDMRSFIDRLHGEGIHSVLWFKLWDGEGLDPALCVKTDDGEVRVDPSNPEYIRILKETLHYLLSADDGCLNADGLKLDFAFFNPTGRRFTTHSGKYGCELLYNYMQVIYQTAKAVKPDALINCSPCHPYFAHLCDQARLHDYNINNRSNWEDMAMRARLFAIANPHTPIDTDNAGFNTRRDTMRWLLNQGAVGVPDLYSLTPFRDGDMTDTEFEQISAVWKEYSARVDEMYPSVSEK